MFSSVVVTRLSGGDTFCSLQSAVRFGNFTAGDHERRNIDSLERKLRRFFCKSFTLVHRCDEYHSTGYDKFLDKLGNVKPRELTKTRTDRFKKSFIPTISPFISNI